MPPKTKDIATYISILLSAVMIVTFIATRRDVSESKLKSKAEKTYVDDRDKGLSKQIETGDAVLKNQADTYITEHAATHKAEMGKLDIVVDWVKSQPNN